MVSSAALAIARLLAGRVLRRAQARFDRSVDDVVDRAWKAVAARLRRKVPEALDRLVSNPESEAAVREVADSVDDVAKRDAGVRREMEEVLAEAHAHPSLRQLIAFEGPLTFEGPTIFAPAGRVTTAGRDAIQVVNIEIHGPVQVSPTDRVSSLDMSDVAAKIASAVEVEQVPETEEEQVRALGAARRTRNHTAEATALANLGASHYWHGKLAESLADYEQSLAIALEVGDRHAEGELLKNIAMVLHVQGRREEALTRLNESLSIARDLNDRSLRARSLANLASIASGDSRFDEAVSNYEESLSLARELKDRELEAKILHNLGNLCWRMGRSDDAVNRLSRSLEISEQIGDRAIQGATLNALGSYFSSLDGRSSEAIDALDRSIEHARAAADKSTEAASLLTLGRVFVDSAEWDKAARSMEGSCKLGRSIGDHRLEAEASAGLAHIRRQQRRPQDAHVHLMEAEKAAQRAGDRLLQANVLVRLGASYGERGWWGVAGSHCERGLLIARQMGSERVEFQALYGLARARHGEGRNDEAISVLRESLSLARHGDDPGDVGAVLTYLGDLLSESDRRLEAQAAWREALTIFEQAGHPEAKRVRRRLKRRR